MGQGILCGEKLMSIRTFSLLALPVAVSLGFGQASFAQENNQNLTRCGMINNDVARLICYDELLSGNTPDALTQKRSVHLSSTIKSTVLGNPQVLFLGDDETVATQADEKTDHQPSHNNGDTPTQSKALSDQSTNPPDPANAPSVDKFTQVTGVLGEQDDELSSTATLSENPPQKQSLATQLGKRLSNSVSAFSGWFGKNEKTYQDNVATSTQGKVLTELNAPKDALERYSPLSLSLDLDKNSERGLWSPRPHNANYILPYYYNTKPNYHPMSPTLGSAQFDDDELRKIELKFQLSLKTKAAQNLFGTNADLWIGYTQQSHWQTYNENNSRPFRAHDYQPEIFLTQPVVADLPWNGKLRMLGVGAIHHSNGESDPVSRSWNRLYVMGGAEWGNLTVAPKLWTALKKKEGSKPSDNPDMTDYYGFGEVQFLYRLDDGKNASGVLRFNPSTRKGSVQLNYIYPIGRNISGHFQVFHGYGQSLVDYNHEATSFGFGIMLNDWMGL